MLSYSISPHPILRIFLIVSHRIAGVSSQHISSHPPCHPITPHLISPSTNTQNPFNPAYFYPNPNINLHSRTGWDSGPVTNRWMNEGMIINVLTLGSVASPRLQSAQVCHYFPLVTVTVLQHNPNQTKSAWLIGSTVGCPDQDEWWYGQVRFKIRYIPIQIFQLNKSPARFNSHQTKHKESKTRNIKTSKTSKTSNVYHTNVNVNVHVRAGHNGGFIDRPGRAENGIGPRGISVVQALTPGRWKLQAHLHFFLYAAAVSTSSHNDNCAVPCSCSVHTGFDSNLTLPPPVQGVSMSTQSIPSKSRSRCR